MNIVEILQEAKVGSGLRCDRVTAEDINKVLQVVSSAIKLPYQLLQENLIGSSATVYSGKKAEAGDVDIAIETDDYAPIDDRMQRIAQKGIYRPGTGVGSYAISIGKKLIQVDLMFVKNLSWAKWMYHSAHGSESSYPGVVRNIILLTALAYTQKAGKDFVIRDEGGRAVVRASNSVHLQSGMQRLFKMAKYNMDKGTYGKTLYKVNPQSIRDHLTDLGKHVDFSDESEFTNDPDEIATFIFGEGVKAGDLMTAEQVISHIKQLPNAKTILKACVGELKRLRLPTPPELSDLK